MGDWREVGNKVSRARGKELKSQNFVGGFFEVLVCLMKFREKLRQAL
jgi:uncharacterized membrane protein YsdA (DUF1294 family)